MFTKAVKTLFIFFAYVWQCAVCFSLEVPVNISKSDCTVIRVNKRRLLNPFGLIRGSYHSEIWGDAHDLSALPLSQGPFEQRDSLWRWHCVSKKPAWNLYSLKSPLIKQSLGGGCKKCMGDSSEGWCFSPATYSMMCCKCHINCELCGCCTSVLIYISQSTTAVTAMAARTELLVKTLVLHLTFKSKELRKPNHSIIPRGTSWALFHLLFCHASGEL